MTKISTTLIKNQRKLKLKKIINFAEVKSAKEKLNEMNSELIEESRLLNLDPNLKVYSLIQNVMSFFAEEISVEIAFNAYYDKMEELLDEFMPSYPPGSPLTSTYFTYWAFCDFQFGKEKETINSILSDLGKEFNYDELIMQGLSNFSTSCMRFYKHMGSDDNLIVLKDIFTDKKFHCICPAGYNGNKGEIWYARIVPNLDKVYDYQIVLTTPYVILEYKEKDWLDFFQRQGITKGKLGFEKKYHDFMKYHVDYKYWHNYVMDGFVNYRPDCIYLTGIPDIKGSKPHELESIQ